VDRTEASIAPARGGDRTDSRVPVGRILAVLVIVGLSVANAWWSPRADAAGSAKATSSGPSLSLLAPPPVAGPSAAFALRLGVTGTVPRADLTLGVTVYGALSTSTEFNETLSGSPVGSVLARSSPLALSSLTADATDPTTAVDVSVPVAAGGRPGTGSGPFSVTLHCQLGSCDGVYPVALELTDTATHKVTSRLLTYLAYADPSADTERLRFALVLPLLLPSSTASPSAVPPVGAAALDRLDAVVAAAAAGARADVPLTLMPGPATVAALAADRAAKSRAALAALVSLATSPVRQTLCGPYVPVDASAAASVTVAGATELAQQVRRGAQILDAVPALRPACAAAGAWVSDTTLDSGALAALSTLGYNQAVISPSAVAGPSPATTPTRRFTLDGAPRASSAALSDPQLASLLGSTSRTDPALAADQLLAELEFDYTEAPYAPQPRGVVVASAAATTTDPTVLADVLAGLQDNPMVEPVTLATLFTDVPVGGTVGGFSQPATRRPAPDNASGLPAAAVSAARTQLAGFAATVATTSAGTAVATGLGDMLLASENQLLSPAQQRAGVRHFEDALHQQLAQLSITSREVRLTARTGSVPITVIKSTPYPVEAVLTVTSDKIAFSSDGAQVSNTECRTPVVTSAVGRSSVSTLCTFVHGTNAVYIEMRSRVSARFRISVTLTSPEGALALTSGQLTVQSMSTSAVAIALSVAAGAVLLGWWGRTLVRARKTRRGAHVRGGSET
jgi:hypothetical protein